ncbi:MAG: hypothetical protein IPH11_12505 [Ignavibacteriales bacterium]|nr:hypothetical protein [Ignavibacteriales bacterium]
MSHGDVDKTRREIWEKIESGEMPLGTYTLIHPEIKFSEPGFIYHQGVGGNNGQEI